MKIGRLFMIIGFTLGTLAAVWLLTQRRLPTIRVSYVVGRGREVGLDWIQLN